MMQLKSLLTGLAASLAAAPALAQDLEIVGKPVPNGVGFQPAATELARDLQWLDGMLLVVITIICIFVAGLMVYCFARFNRKANPTPKAFTHNTPIEVAWTVGPIAILVLIGSFSLPVLFKQQEIPEGDIVIKATGYQWYWGYEYTDHEFAFDSYMIGAPATLGDGDEDVTPFVLNDAMEIMTEFLLKFFAFLLYPVQFMLIVSIFLLRVSPGTVSRYVDIPYIMASYTPHVNNLKH